MSKRVPAQEQRSVDISVIIATRNRAQSLKDTLVSLAIQETEGRFHYEVVVVDNGSTDETKSVVDMMRRTMPVPLRYLYEGRQGKPWAMNRALAEAHGTFFVLTDDDVVVTPRWILAFWRCFTEEGADAIGGRTRPQWLGARPEWLTDELVMHIGSLACMDHGPTRQRGRYAWAGANMALRRQLVERLGGFDVRTERASDTEYFFRCLRAKALIYYEPEALAYHKVGPERLTLTFFREWRRINGYYHAYLPPWRKYHLVTLMPVGWYRELLSWVGEWIVGTLTEGPWGERFRCELMLRDCWYQWLHRLQMWPRWCATVATGRSYLP